MVDTALGQRLKQPVQRLLGRVGWELRRMDADGASASLTRLIGDHQIRSVLDVGANVGQFATRLRLAGYDGSIFSIEPGEQAFGRLQRASRSDPLWDCVNCAAGARPQRLNLNISTNSTSSSLFPISARHVQAAPESTTKALDEVRVDTIDNLVSEHTLRGPFMMKLDVQGYEIEALKGAEVALRSTPVLNVEISFDVLFEGGANYLEVLAALDAAGYRPVAIDRGFTDPITGELLQCDLTLVVR